MGTVVWFRLLRFIWLRILACQHDLDNHPLNDEKATNHGETVTSKYSIATELPPACASINEINVQPVGTKPLLDTGFISTVPFQDLSRPPSHHPTLNGAVLSPWFTPSPCSNPESHIPPPSTCKPQRPTSKYRLDRSCITAKVNGSSPMSLRQDQELLCCLTSKLGHRSCVSLKTGRLKALDGEGR